jgi:hypothetical protein
MEHRGIQPRRRHLPASHRPARRERRGSRERGACRKEISSLHLGSRAASGAARCAGGEGDRRRSRYRPAHTVFKRGTVTNTSWTSGSARRRAAFPSDERRFQQGSCELSREANDHFDPTGTPPV